MKRRQLLRAPIISLCLAILSAVIPASSLSIQDIKPGASPAWIVGNPNAPVSIEVFNDYQCRPCGTFNEQLKKLRAKYRGNVQIVFRNLPLTRTHQNALAAAQAAEASGIQGKFVEMIDLLYNNLRQWAELENPTEAFRSYARKIHLDLDRFSNDMVGEQVRERILLDVERAKSLDVTATPTVLLNGKTLSVEMEADIDQLIEKTLKESKDTDECNSTTK
jgi:protein-disulfide isomerase